MGLDEGAAGRSDPPMLLVALLGTESISRVESKQPSLAYPRAGCPGKGGGGRRIPEGRPDPPERDTQQPV